MFPNISVVLAILLYNSLLKMNYLYYQIWTKESISCHIWNQNSWICLILKYREVMKMPKFETKNALFGYFWTWILKNYCHIWNKHPQICVFAKFHEKTKIPKFRTKNAWSMYFWDWNLKTRLSNLKSAPSNLSNCKVLWRNKSA